MNKKILSHFLLCLLSIHLVMPLQVWGQNTDEQQEEQIETVHTKKSGLRYKIRRTFRKARRFVKQHHVEIVALTVAITGALFAHIKLRLHKKQQESMAQRQREREEEARRQEGRNRQRQQQEHVRQNEEIERWLREAGLQQQPQAPNPQQLRRRAPAYQAPHARVQVELQEGDCPVCDEHRAANEFTALACGHFLCTECQRNIVRTAFASNNAHPHCSQAGCTWNMDDRDIYAIAQNDRELLDRYATLTMNEFTGNYLIPCPRPDCKAAYYPDDEHQRQFAHCITCNQRFCSHCGTDHRAEITCARAAEERNMTPEERANNEWLANNTKPCPGCHNPIEKNLGCNHITCRTRGTAGRGCGRHFCWVCLSPWDLTFGHYQCSNDACPSKR